MEHCEQTDPAHTDYYRKLLPASSPFFAILHKIVKPLIRGAIETNGRMLNPIVEQKKKHGWVNPEVGMLYANLTEVIELDSKKWRAEGNFPNSDYLMFCNLRDTLCVVLDEDSHYLLRFFYLVEILNRDYPDYRIEMHKQKAYWNWPEVMEGIRKEVKEWQSREQPSRQSQG